MIARSQASARIAAVLEVTVDITPTQAERIANRLVDEIYGVPGADATNPRYGNSSAGTVTADA